MNVASGGEYIGDSIKYLATGKLDDNFYAKSSSAIRGAVSEKVDWEIGNWDAFDFVYNTVMSGVDSLAVAPFGTAGAVSLGLSAAANSTNDILSRGGSNQQAFVGGIVSGVFEGFFEKFSISQLESMKEGTVKGFKDYAKNLYKAMVVNASEETATEAANILYDYMANGGISQYNILVQKFVSAGDDEATAKKKAALKLGQQILEAGASGALMGFGFASLGSGLAYKKYKNSPEYQRIKSNGEILNLIQKVKSGKFKANDKVYLEKTTPEVVKKIQQITGIDVSDFKVAIEARQIEHILKDHGVEGKTDHSMSDDVDISKMEYILSHPDDVRKAGKTRAYTYMKDGRNRTADTVLYEKVLDENSYYVVQAVPDTKAKTLYIVSAFIGESGYKKEASQLTDANSPGATPNGGSVMASNPNISQSDNGVNNNISAQAANNSQNSGLQSSANGGIISNKTEPIGRDEYDRNYSERNAKSSESGKTTYRKTNENSAGNYEENSNSFAERIKRLVGQGGRGRLLTLQSKSGKKTLIGYIVKGPDDSEAYRAVKMLKNKGYDVDYSEGSIEINIDDITRHSNNAVTTKDGKIIVSSNNQGSAEQTADHEEVHLLQTLKNEDFVAYRNVLVKNIIIDSGAYLVIAQDINKKHFFVEERVNEKTGKTERIGKYSDEELLSKEVVPKIFKELIAYLRQCYNYDADMAKQTYGDLFQNWEEVADAIDEFNNSVGKNIPNENNGFLYQNSDIEKVRQLLARNGLQLPTPLKLSDSDINISQNDTGVNNNISAQALNNSQNQILQSSANGGIINNGGDENVIPNQGAVSGSGEKTVTVHTGENQKDTSKSQEVLRNDTGGAQSVRQKSIRHRTVKHKNGHVSYAEAHPDNSEGGRAYNALKNAGINAVYCDGEIELTKGDITALRTEAITASDGTVYVSSKATLPAKEIYDHERVHVADFTNNPIYTEYQAVLCDNIDYSSEIYICVADEINREQFTKEIIKDPKTGEIIEKIGKYDIEDMSTYPLFMREIAAYVNQFVLSDPEFAEQKFGGMFKDWGAVVEAVNKFNTDMGADFSESVSFMYENPTLQSSANGGIINNGINPSNKKITPNMSDLEKSEILKNKRINNVAVATELPSYITEKITELSSYDDINKLFGKNKISLIKRVASEFGVFKKYENSDVNLEFEFTNNNFRESYHKQKKNYEKFTKMFSVFDSVIENAVCVEAHKRENYKPDPTLENVYVMISAFEDGELIVPVKLEIKEFNDKPNKLYVAIALEGIKKAEVSKQGTTENGVAQSSRSANISIYDLILKINPTDKNFLKYIPNQLLNEKQIEAKNIFLEALNGNDFSSESRNGALKPNTGVTEATPNDGAASFMPENGLDEILDETDSQGDGLPRSARNDNGESGADESRPIFREANAREIDRPATLQEQYDTMLGRNKTVAQKHIDDIAKKLDSNLRIVWVEKASKELNGKNGKYVRGTNTIYIAKDISTAEMYFEVFKHEFVHRLESKGSYKAFKEYLINRSTAFEQYVRSQLKIVNGETFKGDREEAMKALADYYYNNFVNDKTISKPIRDKFTLEDAEREMVADFGGEVLFKGKQNHADTAQALADEDLLAVGSIETSIEALTELAKTDRNLFQKMWDAIKEFIRLLQGSPQTKRLVEDLEYIEQRLARVYDSADTKKAAKNSGGVRYSFMGYADDGKGKYKSNFQKGTPKSAKGEKILKYIRDVWSKKPIRLKIAENGAIRYIEAKFDPTYDESGNIPTDASKLMGGNRHGTSSEQRVTLDLADDYYQIASESQYNYSKDETGKDNPAHKDVSKWHYFINDIYFAEYESEKYEPYRVSINVKEKSDGEYVYSFSAEKQRESDTPRTLHAVVNEGKNPDANVELSNNRVAQNQSTVKNNISTENKNYSEDGPFSSGSPMQQARENLTRYESGEISREEYLEENDRLWGEANQRYGSFPKGEKAQTEIAVPSAVAEDKPNERFIRTIIETGKLTDEMLEEVEGKLITGDFTYKVSSDDAAIKKAEFAFKSGTAEDLWTQTVGGDAKITKTQIAVGERLLVEAMEKEDTKRVLELSSELADIFTRAGQVVQSARLLKQMTGTGRLVSAQRAVKTLNKSLTEKYGDKREPIKISPNAARRLATAKTEKGIEHAYGEIMQEVADQMPVTWLDKWNAWRYFAMLSNIKTHIRNIVGNAIFVPAVRIKNFIATGIEAGAALKWSIDKTKSIVIKKEYVDFAKRDGKSDSVKQLLKGNKYNDNSALREKQRIFKNNTLEFLTRFNSNALEMEDMLFKNKHYIHALAGFLQARKVDLSVVSEELLVEARTYAVNEARKATFNDESVLADLVQNFGNKNLATNIMVEGVLPFKRTPINIIKRGIEYSPLGLAKTLTKSVYDVKKGKITPTEFIDGLASGLTGTGIMLAGMFLTSLGCITGGMEDDEESLFEKLLGKQEYAVEFFGMSYTIDWGAPACIPFFIGVEMINSISSGEDFSFANLGNVAWNVLEPITELSMLSGLQSVIDATRYAESNQIFGAIIGDALLSYGMQGVPAVLGAVGRTIDPIQRTWYTDKNSKLFDSFAQSAINNVKSKIPGLSYTMPAKIDAWGREVSRGNLGERLTENFVSPGYYSKVDYDEVSDELKKIFVKTGGKVFPKTADKSFSVDGKEKYLTADEYVKFAKAKGEMSFDYVKEFVDSRAYKKLDYDERAEVIENLYSFANAKAKAEVSKYDPSKISTYKSVVKYERSGGSAVNYYISKAISK